MKNLKFLKQMIIFEIKRENVWSLIKKQSLTLRSHQPEKIDCLRNSTQSEKEKIMKGFVLAEGGIFRMRNLSFG